MGTGNAIGCSGGIRSILIFSEGDLTPPNSENSQSGFILVPVPLFPDPFDRPVSAVFQGGFPENPYSCPDCQNGGFSWRKTGLNRAGFMGGSVRGMRFRLWGVGWRNRDMAVRGYVTRYCSWILRTFFAATARLALCPGANGSYFLQMYPPQPRTRILYIRNVNKLQKIYTGNVNDCRLCAGGGKAGGGTKGRRSFKVPEKVLKNENQPDFRSFC